MTQFKDEKNTFIVQKENNDTNQEQVDSSNIIASSEDSKTKLLNTINSDVVDSNEAEAKEIDRTEPQANEAGVNAVSFTQKQTIITIDSDSTSTQENTKEFEGEINVALIDSKSTKKKKFEVENNEIKQTKCLDNLDTDTGVKEKTSIIKNDMEKPNTINNQQSETNEDEDDIQDEELDHEIDEELDHEVNEELDHEIDEETNGDDDDLNQTNNTVSLSETYLSSMFLFNYHIFT